MNVLIVIGVVVIIGAFLISPKTCRRILVKLHLPHSMSLAATTTKTTALNFHCGSFGDEDPSIIAIRTRLTSLNVDHTSCSSQSDLIYLLRFLLALGDEREESGNERLERSVERKILPSFSTQRFLMTLDHTKYGKHKQQQQQQHAEGQEEAEVTRLLKEITGSILGRIDPRSMGTWRNSIKGCFERQFNLDERVGKWLGNHFEATSAGLHFRQTLLIIARTLDSQAGRCRRFIIQDDAETEAIVIDVWSIRNTIIETSAVFNSNSYTPNNRNNNSSNSSNNNHNNNSNNSNSFTYSIPTSYIPLIEIGFSHRTRGDDATSCAKILSNYCPGDGSVQPIAATLAEIHFAYEILFANTQRLPKDYISSRHRRWTREYDKEYSSVFEPSFILPISAPLPFQFTKLRGITTQQQNRQQQPIDSANDDALVEDLTSTSNQNPKSQQQQQQPQQEETNNVINVIKTESNPTKPISTPTNKIQTITIPDQQQQQQQQQTTANTPSSGSSTNSLNLPPGFCNNSSVLNNSGGISCNNSGILTTSSSSVSSSESNSPLPSPPHSPVCLRPTQQQFNSTLPLDIPTQTTTSEMKQQQQKQQQQETTTTTTATTVPIHQSKHKSGLKRKKVCVSCGKPATGVCARCRRVRYCSPECQTTDWPTHKKQCQLIQTKEEKQEKQEEEEEKLVLLLTNEAREEGSVFLLPHAKIEKQENERNCEKEEEEERIIIKAQMLTMPGTQKRLVLLTNRNNALQVVVTPASNSFVQIRHEIAHAYCIASSVTTTTNTNHPNSTSSSNAPSTSAFFNAKWNHKQQSLELLIHKNHHHQQQQEIEIW